MDGLSSTWQRRQQMVRKLLLCALVLAVAMSGVAALPPQATIASSAVNFTWDSQADFERNASTTGEPTTRTGLSTEARPGSVSFGYVWIKATSAGGYHTVGLKSDGTVVAVGRNDYGQCNVSDWRSHLNPRPRMGAIGGAGAIGLRAKGGRNFGAGRRFQLISRH